VQRGERQQQGGLGEEKPVEEDRDAVQRQQPVAGLRIGDKDAGPRQRRERAEDEAQRQRQEGGADQAGEQPPVAPGQAAHAVDETRFHCRRS
jgi:hypothetical protein